MKNLGKIWLIMIILPLLLYAAADVHKQKQTKGDAFLFTQSVDKESVYVGEPLLLTYTFMQRNDKQLSEADFNPPSFHGFWAKTTHKIPNQKEGNYTVYRINYLLYPQKSGTLQIESGRMNIGVIHQRSQQFYNFQRIEWKTIFSNPLKVQVKALPAGVDIYGNYTFSVFVDKNITRVNEPVNLTIKIRGEGNVDDIDDFKLDVAHATVYADKAQKTANLTNKKTDVAFEQKFAIVSDHNFTIPALDFKFFDGTVHTLHSKAINIAVKNAKVSTKAALLEKKEPLKEVTSKVQADTNSYSAWTIMIVAFCAFLSGIAAAWLSRQWFRMHRKVAQKPLEKRILESKDDKALLAILLPMIDKTPKIKHLIKELEENIYDGKAHTIDKKKLVKEFASYLKCEQEEEILKG